MANKIQFFSASPKIPVNNTTKSTELTIVPDRIQGLNLPHFVRVLSTMFPKTGSIMISTTLITTIRVVIKTISLLAMFFGNPTNKPLVTKMMK